MKDIEVHQVLTIEDVSAQDPAGIFDAIVVEVKDDSITVVIEGDGDFLTLNRKWLDEGDNVYTVSAKKIEKPVYELLRSIVQKEYDKRQLAAIDCERMLEIIATAEAHEL